MRLTLAFLFIVCRISAQNTIVSRDTFPDLNEQEWIRHDYEKNREVTIAGVIEYALIAYPGRPEPRLEYFRMNDSVYYCFEYYPDSSWKAKGNYLVTNDISGVDTVWAEDPLNPGTFFRMLRYYRAIVKTGHWIEFDTLSPFRGSWEGEYERGKRVGVWKHNIYGYGETFERELIDYDKDSTKKFSQENLALMMPVDSLRKMLGGRWSFANIDCDEDGTRMLYYRCRTYNGNYGDDCNNEMVSVEYYDFLARNKFTHQLSFSCNKSFEGKWKVTREGEATFVLITMKDQPPMKLRILYLDRNGRLVTERVI